MRRASSANPSAHSRASGNPKSRRIPSWNTGSRCAGTSGVGYTPPPRRRRHVASDHAAGSRMNCSTSLSMPFEAARGLGGGEHIHHVASACRLMPRPARSSRCRKKCRRRTRRNVLDRAPASRNALQNSLCCARPRHVFDSSTRWPSTTLLHLRVSPKPFGFLHILHRRISRSAIQGRTESPLFPPGDHVELFEAASRITAQHRSPLASGERADRK